MQPPGYLRFFDRLNPLIVALLRSPLHRLLSPGLMVLAVTGRKSGRRYSFPVGYHQLPDAIVVLVSNAAARNWWRNFRQPGPVEMRIRGRDLRGTAEVLTPDQDDFKLRVEQSFRRAAFIPRLFEIDFDPERGLTPQQIESLAAYAAVVRITPEA